MRQTYGVALPATTPTGAGGPGAMARRACSHKRNGVPKPLTAIRVGRLSAATELLVILTLAWPGNAGVAGGIDPGVKFGVRIT